ncbi:unnamed protein product [Blepharisma stoltei]|uniref:Uncharacterized protein n=1 Tax=Blepharisma stoltei TaxID=1481888 RepID=A0AAU9KB13_9CILI|nr:unnamed protein product [Blepharisma stoltei]
MHSSVFFSAKSTNPGHSEHNIGNRDSLNLSKNSWDAAFSDISLAKFTLRTLSTPKDFSFPEILLKASWGEILKYLEIAKIVCWDREIAILIWPRFFLKISKECCSRKTALD